MPDLADIAVVLGMILGSLLLGAVAWVWVKNREFGIGGSVLTVFGVMLVGLSIWSTVKVSVTPEGGIEASFEQRLASVEKEVQQVEHQVQEFRSDVVSTVSAVASVPPEQVQRLRQRETVDRLVRERNYRQALELDPDNTIAIMRLIEEEVEATNYAEATSLYDRLRAANDSGVGYSVFPDLALAFERAGDSETALAVLVELDRVIDDDIAKGYGYLSRSEQLGWIRRDLARVRGKVSDRAVADAIDRLSQKIGETITELRRR